MDTLSITGALSFLPSPIYYIGLHDRESVDYNYKSRDPNNSIPEVIKLGNGDACSLVEPVEWLWHWSWAWRHPSFVESGGSLTYWKSKMRGNGAFTNKFGSDTKRSFVLGTNIFKEDGTLNEPMRSEGVDCPGGNLFRGTGDPDKDIGGRMSAAVWCLDYHWLKTLTVTEAKVLATTLPRWLLHIAQDVHPDGSFSSWDYGFTVPMMASDPTEKTAIVDGFHCRQNYMRLSRLSLS